jgi:hypothetical protein
MALNGGTGAKAGLEKLPSSFPTPTSPSAEEDTSHGSAPSGSGGPEFRLDASLSVDGALSLLRRADLPPDVLEQLSKIGELLKYPKVKLALVEHPKTPRHVSLPLIRQLYTFDLMQMALTPVVPADVKRAADEALAHRLETLASGERLTLAHRGSGRIAEALLADADARVMRAALQNARLTEASVVRILTRPDAPFACVDAVARHPQWALRREVRVALLRNEKTPMARALEFARGLPPGLLREILQTSRLPAKVKEHLLAEIGQRGG